MIISTMIMRILMMIIMIMMVIILIIIMMIIIMIIIILRSYDTFRNLRLISLKFCQRKEHSTVIFKTT